MAYFFPLLLYLGLGGSLLLLGTSSFSGLRSLHKPLAAACMTLLTLAWAAGPTMGKWVLSVWAPISVTGGWLVLDLQPAMWWAMLMIGAAVSGVLWIDLTEQRADLSFGGPLLLLLFTVTWLTFSAGSLLMTLALWAVFDVVWMVVRLIANSEGERVVWAAAVQGLASILLWTLSLFLFREGTSGMWWLMRPSSPLLVLMYVAAAMRLGFYPFQVVNTETLSPSHPLSVMSIVNPLMGIALLARLIALPGAESPAWIPIWGTVTLLWLGIRAFSLRGRQAVVVAGHAMLLGAVIGAVALENAVLLLIGVGVWLASMALLIVAKRFQPRDVYLSWPTVLAVCFLVGAPPSPLLVLYRGIFGALAWPWRLAALLGLAVSAAALLRGISQRAHGRARPPSHYLLVGALAGLVLVVGILLGAATQVDAPFGDALSLLLWGLSLVVTFALLRWGRVVQRVLDRARPLVDLLDLQWLYGAIWEGAENLLGVIRATAEVVEGSGSILWSVLILLLVLMILGRQ